MSKITKRKIAVFDIDGTIFRNSLLVELHWKMVKAGIIPKAAIKKLDRRYWEWVQRKGAYDDYLSEVIKSFDDFSVGQKVSIIKKLASKVVKVQSNIVYRYTRDLIAKLRQTHILVAISGSPKEIVEEFAHAWKFDHFVGTEHEIMNGKYTAGPKFVASQHKREVLLNLVKQHGFNLSGSVGVGDTESDAEMLDLVAYPICFNPTSGLYKIAKRKKWPVAVERKDVIYRLQRVLCHPRARRTRQEPRIQNFDGMDCPVTPDNDRGEAIFPGSPTSEKSRTS
ncbi:MAG: HAD family phosphatase [bacterium]|nr:HAD family phosphatase [bacterium]